ncbi:ORF1 [Ostreid herpesvirus 1]|nr:ORF1 [Ostreid herpesvirus 1]UPX73441.1 ORF1 [Ostreid herpesvirus 1]
MAQQQHEVTVTAELVGGGEMSKELRDMAAVVSLLHDRKPVEEITCQELRVACALLKNAVRPHCSTDDDKAAVDEFGRLLERLRDAKSGLGWFMTMSRDDSWPMENMRRALTRMCQLDYDNLVREVSEKRMDIVHTVGRLYLAMGGHLG